MTRYVEESEVIRVLTEYYHLKTDVQIKALSEALSRVPDADVVELVRCKECKWFGKAGCAVMIVDESDKPTEDDYCSFAERRE